MTEYKVIVDEWNAVRWHKPNTDILHREDGPAIEFANGDTSWYINGELHREDGPAIEWAGGDKLWYINGKCLSEEQFNNRYKTELTLDEIASKFGIDVKNLKIKK